MLTTELIYKQSSLLQISLEITLIAITLSASILATENILLEGLIITSTVLLVVYIIYRSMYRPSPVVAKLAIFMFVRECCLIDVEAGFFYWYTEAQFGPKFTVEFVGLIGSVGYVATFIGVAAYNKYFHDVPYREIFFGAQIVLVFTNLMDIIMVLRINLSVGIPDTWFILGDNMLTPLVRRLIIMPTSILAAKLCPAGAEATFFALLMSISNLGHDIALYYGATLLAYLQIGDPHWYSQHSDWD